MRQKFVVKSVGKGPDRGWKGEHYFKWRFGTKADDAEQSSGRSLLPLEMHFLMSGGAATRHLVT